MTLYRTLVIASGVTFVIFQAAGFGAFMYWLVEIKNVKVLNGALPLALAASVWSTVNWCKSLLARSGAELLAADTRPPIVYLRSFAEDVDAGEVRPGLDYQTREKMICSVLEAVGPIVALGKPGDALPSLGAARIYVEPHADWQLQIKALLRAARLVVISAQTSDGIVWEIREVVQSVAPERVILLLPQIVTPSLTKRSARKRIAKAYERFREQAQSLFPRGLPTSVGGSNILLFTSDWEAYVPMVIKLKSSRINMAGKSLFTEALRPHLGHLGISLAPLSWRARFAFYWPKTSFITLLLLLAVLAVTAPIIMLVGFGIIASLVHWVKSVLL